MVQRPVPARRLRLIGIGVGSVEHVTAEAVAALHEVDVVFTVDKGETMDDLNVLRRQICDRYGRPGLRTVAVHEPDRDRDPADYPSEVRRWHDARAQVWADALRDELSESTVGAFLVWGDPALYDSTLRILDTIADRGHVALDVDVIPGITSVQVLTARHRIPLNTIGGPVRITTGRRLVDDAAGADPAESIVVMLDGGSAFAGLDPTAWDIWWGAYLGSSDEILLAGALADVGDRITATKREARARVGWVMDVYLLRRRPARSAGG